MGGFDMLRFSGIPGITDAFTTLAAAGTIVTQNLFETESQTHLLRIYADAKGDSQMEELAIATKPTPEGWAREAQRVPVTGVIVRETSPKRDFHWHTVSVPSFAITIVGEIEVEVSGGARRRIRAGDIVFLEDTKGKGHITRQKVHVTNLFINVPDGFDVVAWLRGKA
ncbi:hypothetical protein ACFLZG_03355 [Thermodesulfobacteriota bacterium]